MYKMLLVVALLCSATVSDAQSFRLIGHTRSRFENGAYKKIDTNIYKYSFGRGLFPENSARYIYETWACDTTGKWLINGGQLTWLGRIGQKFDGSGRLIYRCQVNSSGDTTYRTSYHYTGNYHDTSFAESKVSSVWTPSYKEINVYGSDGIISNLRLYWDNSSGTWINDGRTSYTYLSGQLSEELKENWNGSAWEPYSHNTYSYVGDNLSTMIQESYFTGSPTIIKYAYSYDQNDDMTERLGYLWVSGAWELKNRSLYTYDSDHNELTITDQLYNNGQYTNQRHEEYTYNNANLAETYRYMNEWDGTQFVPYQNDESWAYYYEEYDPASAGNTVKNNTQLQVFPNPATNNIRIRSFTAQSKPFGITIFDATGRSVRHWNEAPTTFYQKQVDVQELPSGSYFLRIDNLPQEAVQFTILK